MSDARCPICRGPCATFVGPRLATAFDCPSCLRYEITMKAGMLLAAKSADRVLALQSLTRAAAARGRILLLTSLDVGSL